MIPRLAYSELTGRVYVLTRFRMKPMKDGLGVIVIASKKYDVTEDFAALRKKRLRGVGRRVKGLTRTVPRKAQRPERYPIRDRAILGSPDLLP